MGIEGGDQEKLPAKAWSMSSSPDGVPANRVAYVKAWPLRGLQVVG